MFSCRLGEMGLLRSGSSGACCVHMEANPGRSLRISYDVAHRELIPETIHVNDRYANNRVEQAHEATRVRERGMRKFKSLRHAHRFLGVHAAASNLFNLGRHMITAEHYRNLRVSAFEEWSRAVA